MVQVSIRNAKLGVRERTHHPGKICENGHQTRLVKGSLQSVQFGCDLCANCFPVQAMLSGCVVDALSLHPPAGRRRGFGKNKTIQNENPTPFFFFQIDFKMYFLKRTLEIDFNVVFLGMKNGFLLANETVSRRAN